MAVVSTMELGRELVLTMQQVNEQIEAVKRAALVSGIPVYDMRDANGSFVLAPLLAAKAQTLHALTLINKKG
jgi:hypothetical protein